jgi:SPP1 family predicted phage head-tail adaptor
VIKAGELNQRVTLLAPVVTKGAAGGQSISYQPVRRISAKVTDLSGREFLAASQINADVTTTFLIRARADIRADWRIRFQARDYDIVALPTVERSREGLQIMAKARVD